MLSIRPFHGRRCRLVPRSAARLVLLLAALWLLAVSPLAADTLVWAGTLIDGTSSEVRREATVVVRDGLVVEVVDGYRQAGEGDEVVDLKDATVLPGLIDLHTHLSSESTRGGYLKRFQAGPTDYAVESVAHAESTLRAGFTTVRNVGDRYGETLSLRDAVARGVVPGPRIFTAGGSLATTGGHADPTTGHRPDLAGDPGPKEGVINSPDDARKAVRQRYKDGVDLIKITATGGVLSMAKSGQNPQFTMEELREVVDTAADYGFHVAAHAHGTEGLERAVRAGVRTIEHGTYLDDEAMELMKEHGTYLVPTLLAGAFVSEKAKEEGYYPEMVRVKAAKIGPVMQDTFRRAVEKGVPIAFGTDSGVSPHGENAREFALMVEGGMDPMTAIRSATAVAAEVLGQSETLGTLEEGKAADLIAVEGDPLDDISVLENVTFVMKGGEIFVGR